MKPSHQKLAGPIGSTRLTRQNTSIDLIRMRGVAEKAARLAGDIQKKHFNSQALAVLENKPRDIKIEVDRLCEEAICDCIRSAYPAHSILTEETGLTQNDSRFVWIIDPLDGTVNYFFGLPLFCTCVACYQLPQAVSVDLNNESNLFLSTKPLVGVVYAPLLDRFYSAASGLGARYNSTPIHLPADMQLKDAMVGISFGSNKRIMTSMEALNAILVRNVKKVRIFGSTGLDLAHVATGHLSALIQLKVRVWDIAAALVIMDESGCLYEVRPGTCGGLQFLAAAPGIFNPLKELMSLAQLPDLSDL